jgi:hypothetical protein
MKRMASLDPRWFGGDLPPAALKITADEEGPVEGKRRRRMPNLRRLAESTDPTIARAAEEVIAMAKLLEIMAKLPPEKRANVLRAAAALHGISL